MSKPLRGLLDRTFIIILASLAAIAALLFTIFNFLPLQQLNEFLGMATFLLVTLLLLAGYSLGFTAAAFVAILVLTKIWDRNMN